MANAPRLMLVGRRLVQFVPVIVLATFVVFGLLKLVPGDLAATLAGEYATEERIAQIRESYGLNDPFLVQYGRWLWNAMQLDLSRSFQSNEPVLEQIMHRFPTTMLLVVGALLVSLVVGVPLGILAATNAGSRLDVAVTSLSSFGVALPNFWLAMILVATFSLSWGWFPATGAVRFGADPAGAIWHAVLPSIALAAGGIAEVVRQLRSALIEILSSQYVRTLYAKGLSPSAILWKHGLKNVAVTLLTVIGLLASRLLGGAVVIEAVFAIPGMGSMVVRAAIVKDFPVVQGVVFTMVILVIAINLVIDLLYTIVDPRVALK
ncbi:MAG: ABC transporter permease [Alphaproteobacteria bacterium]|nr:ABC transporter permease [Alphaproteobacteria bacterium]